MSSEMKREHYFHCGNLLMTKPKRIQLQTYRGIHITMTFFQFVSVSVSTNFIFAIKMQQFMNKLFEYALIKIDICWTV